MRFFDRVGESLDFLSLGSELCFKRGDFKIRERRVSSGVVCVDMFDEDLFE